MTTTTKATATTTTTKATSTTSTTPTGTPNRHPSYFSTRLDAEWARLRFSRRAIEQARRWADGDPDHPLAALVRGLDDLGAIVAATQRGTGVDEAIMLRLVELARTDDLAGRIVIQRLLPGLISRSLPYRDFRCRTDPVEVVVPAAWLAIRRFDTQRRRRHIAASLISDAVFAAFREPQRRRSATESVRSPHQFDENVAVPDRRSTIEEFAEVIRIAHAAGVSTEDLDLLRRLVQLESPAAVALERHVTPRTIRNHRDRAVARVRAALAA